MARPVGIDLGTRTSAAAVADAEGIRLLVDPLGEALLPTAVHFTDGEVRIGEEARILGPSNPARSIYDFVPLVGRPFAGRASLQAQAEMAVGLAPCESGGIGIRIGDAVHPIDRLAAMVLSLLRNRADGATVARIAVPATAGPLRRRAVRAAALRAGFSAPRLVSAPLAAAVDHGIGRAGRERAWVVDLGASAVEVALVEADPRLVELRGARAVPGGGRAIDLALADRIVAQCVQATGADPRSDRAALEVIRREAEWARANLGVLDAVDVTVAALMFRSGQAIDLRARLDAEHLAVELRPIVQGVAAAIDGLRAALDLASVPMPERLLVVGGLGASLPVRALLAGALGVPPEAEDDDAPLLSVVRGAARLAAGLDGRPCIDCQCAPLAAGRAAPSVVIPAGMPLPLSMGCAFDGGSTPVRVWHGAADDPDALAGEVQIDRPARLVLDVDADGVLDARVVPLPGSRFEKSKPPPAGPTGVGAKGGSRTPTS